MRRATITSNAYTTGQNGTVQAGADRVQFTFLTSFTGTVNGVAYTSSDVPQIFDTSDSNITLEAIPYTVTAGTLRVIVQRSQGNT